MTGPKTPRPPGLINAVSFACPFCKKSVRAGVQRKSKLFAVVHPVPACAEFDRLPLNEFLAAANTAAGVPR